jgi:plasmid stabilization system protein ParE
VWFVRHEHHYVFFRELSGGVVGVITVLHERMDLPARIKEVCSRSEFGET